MQDQQQKLTSVVSTDWLADALGTPGLRVVDASWFLPTDHRDPAAEFVAGHIPGAVFFDIDAICDTASDLPHMAPDPKAFAQQVGALGIGTGDQVVAYDAAGLFSAARVWWLFRLMGIDSIAVLDGGLPKWLAEDRVIETGLSAVTRRTVVVDPDPRQVCSIDDVRAAVAQADWQIVDARPQDRFAGTAPEPRADLPSGHMRGAKNVFFKSVLDDNGVLLGRPALQRVFTDAGVDLTRPIITSCGSGVTAAVLSLALDVLGHNEHALYDGAWSEWAATADCEVVRSVK